MSSEGKVQKLGRGSSSNNVFMNIYRKYGIFAVFILMFIISAIISRDFLKPANLVNIVRQNSATTILACGITMLLISGMVDLSGGATMTLAGCLAVGIMRSTNSIPLAILGGVCASSVIGWVSGFMVTKLELLPFIATLAMMNIVKGLLNVYTGGSPILGVGAMGFIGQGQIGPVPFLIIIMFVFLFITHIILRYTKLGLYAYAIGGNQNATVASGINAQRIKRIIFTIHGAMAGFAGIVMMSRLNSGQPSIANAGYEFDAIVAAVVGGTSFSGGIGNVFGTLIGALIVGMINNILVLLNVPTAYQYVVKGLLIAGAVVLDIKTRKIKV